jgi:hypothetical protein
MARPTEDSCLEDALVCGLGEHDCLDAGRSFHGGARVPYVDHFPLTRDWARPSVPGMHTAYLQYADMQICRSVPLRVRGSQPNRVSIGIPG